MIFKFNREVQIDSIESPRLRVSKKGSMDVLLQTFAVWLEVHAVRLIL